MGNEFPRIQYGVGTNKPTHFSQKIFLRYSWYYPPQTDILSLCKGGYGGRGGPIGGYTPCQRGVN